VIVEIEVVPVVAVINVLFGVYVPPELQRVT
jgi:hypothetical protein